MYSNQKHKTKVTSVDLPNETNGAIIQGQVAQASGGNEHIQTILKKLLVDAVLLPIAITHQWILLVNLLNYYHHRHQIIIQNNEQNDQKKGTRILLGNSLELGARMRLLGLGAMGQAAGSNLTADLDLAGLVQTTDEAKDDAGQPESAGKLAVLLDVLELVGTGSINL